MPTRLWDFAGNDKYPACKVMILAKAAGGAVMVVPVGGLDAFQVQQHELTRADAGVDTDEGGE